jgi:hypothetical protein
MNTTAQQAQTLAAQLHDERETRLDAQARLRILADAVQKTLTQICHPLYPHMDDGAMIKGRLLNALDKATK